MNVLYGQQTSLTVENMSFSGARLDQFPTYLRSLALVKLACARANHACGQLDEAKYRQIARACQLVADEPPRDQFPVDVFHGGGGIGVNMNMNEVLATLAGAEVDPVSDVNMSQSTADVCHTALRLTLLTMSRALQSTSLQLERSLQAKATAFAPYQTIARTCLQDGMRVSAGALFKSAASALARLRTDLQPLDAELCRINLGGTVIGSGLGATAEYREIVVAELAAVTQIAFGLHPNLYDAAAYQDDLVKLSGVVQLIASLGQKFAEDLRLLSSGPECGFAELTLPNVQAGSSFFPGKVNPVVPEMMIQCAMLVTANHSAVVAGFGRSEVHLNVFEPMMGFLVIKNMQMLTRALELFDEKCVTGIELNADKCAEYANAGIPLLAEAKQRHGYHYISDLIAGVGLKQAVQQLRAEDQPNNRVEPTTLAETSHTPISQNQGKDR